MRNYIILLIVLLILIVIEIPLISLTSENPFKRESEKMELYTSRWTKAVCNYDINYCIDMLITCNKTKVVEIKPLGEGVFMGEDWKDSRPEELINRWCE